MGEGLLVFDAASARKVVQATRTTLTKASGGAAASRTPLPSVRRRFAVTKGDADNPYPEVGTGANVLPFVLTNREYSATLGRRAVTQADWEQTLVGSSVDERYIPENVTCWADFDGHRWWLESICSTCDGPGIRYGGIELLDLQSAAARECAPQALRLAQRVGLDVSGINELVWPNGANRYGGMIGVIDGRDVPALRDLWEPWREGGIPEATDLPQIQFHDAPAMRASLAALEPLSVEGLCPDAGSGSDSAGESGSGSGSESSEPSCGLWLVALTDARRLYQETKFAAVSDPAMVDWATALDLVVAYPGFGMELLATAIDADHLIPEIDDPRVLEMTRGEWLEAAAWSVGGQWRLRSSGELELQSREDAQATEDENRGRLGSGSGSGSSSASGSSEELPTLIAGQFDQEPIRPIAQVQLCVRTSRGAVPWPRGEEQFSATADPPIDAGLRWNPRTTALWERAPVDGAPEQENAPELQALADALLADAEAWMASEYKVAISGFAYWEPSARDRVVRWIARGECRTIVETLTVEDLPPLLIHRSAVWPREASLVEAITETSVTPGGSVTCKLLATAGRPERRVIARYPSYPTGCTVCANQSVWLDYDRSAGQWILVPWGAGGFAVNCGDCSGSGSGSASTSGSGSGSTSGSGSGPGSGSGSTPGSGSESASTPGSESGSGSTPSSASGSGSASGPGSGSGSAPGSGSGSASASDSTGGSGSILPEGGCCEEGDEMISTYAFEWASNSINGESGGRSLTYQNISGSWVWAWEGRVDFPTPEKPTAHVDMSIYMTCAGSPKTFQVQINFGSATDESPQCNPLLLTLGTIDTGYLAQVDIPDTAFDPPVYLILSGCVVAP